MTSEDEYYFIGVCCYKTRQDSYFSDYCDYTKTIVHFADDNNEAFVTVVRP